MLQRREVENVVPATSDQPSSAQSSKQDRRDPSKLQALGTTESGVSALWESPSQVINRQVGEDESSDTASKGLRGVGKMGWLVLWVRVASEGVGLTYAAVLKNRKGTRATKLWR